MQNAALQDALLILEHLEHNRTWACSMNFESRNMEILSLYI